MPILSEDARRTAPGTRTSAPVTIGIDLRSGPRYPTGIATMTADFRCEQISVVRTDEQILEQVAASRPRVIAIDAPLALPEGRCCARTDCQCASLGIMREVDRACAAAGYRPFPTLLPSMVRMTLRGIALRETLEREGYEVIEVYPGMSQDVMNIPRKRGGVDGLRRGLKRAGVGGLPRRRISHDELDAVTCALTAQLYLDGRTEAMGPGLPVPLILPDRTLQWPG
jgi:uncharacterized protein